MIALPFALLAGILTVVTPCALPLLPVLLGSSICSKSASRPVYIALGFVISFAAVALVLSTATRAWGFQAETLRSIAIGFLVMFGLLMVWPHAFGLASSRALAWIGARDPSSYAPRESNLGGFILGATLGMVWTPCAGPVLGSILTVIATEPDSGFAATLLIVYAMGAALPMLAIAYGGQAVTARLRGAASFIRPIQQVLGLVVIAAAAAMYFQYDTLVTAWLSDFYPSGQIGL